jgi:hypothetical protein
MPITFANPALLLGMLAAAVPVVIHFLSRRRVRRHPFSDLRFLEASQTKQARSLDLRRLLLMLLRVLIILCVALAAAGPRLGGYGAVAGGGRSVLMVLDGSASMQTQHEKGTRYELARDVCVQMAAALDDKSEIQVLLAADQVQPLFASWIPAAGPVAEELAASRPTDGSLDLEAVLREAARWVARAHHRPVEIVILSDLQRILLTQQLREPIAGLQAAGSVRLFLRQVGEEIDNGAIRAVQPPRRAIRAGEALRVEAAVRLGRPEDGYQLLLDGRQVGEVTATGTPGELARIAFALTAPSPGRHRGLVRRLTDRLPVDDERPFILAVPDSIEVLLVHGAERGAAGRGGWRYLAAALSPAPSDSEPSVFQVRERASGELTEGDLTTADVVVLIDPDPLGRQLQGHLLEWLARGGGLALFIGEQPAAGYLRGTLLPALGLPDSATYRHREVANREHVTLLAPDHAIFQGLERESLATLGEVGWQRYFALTEGEADVLLSFTGGAPALVEGTHGRGSFLLAPFDLQPEATDLPFSVMFLPLVQRLVAYLAQGTAAAETDLEVGQRMRLPLSGREAAAFELADAGGLRVIPPGEDQDGVPAQLTWQRGMPVLVGPPARRQGFATFTAEGDTVGTVAVVAPAAEGDPALASPAEMRDYLQEQGLAAASDLGGSSGADFARGSLGWNLTPWLLGLCLGLLGLELFLSRGISGKAAA